MDSEERARRQSLRVIVSEAIMVVAVVATVVVLAFLVSGYWLSSDLTVERQGMLQISSVPTGATVAVDGDAPWYQRTNTSKVLSATNHTITLTKDGYDSWSRTVNIREGLLYRIHYPRLFLIEREPETFYTLTSDSGFSSVTPDRATMLLTNSTTTWQLLNLTSEQPEIKTLDLSGLFGDAAPSVTSAKWANDNEHVLLLTMEGWFLVNIKNPKTSIDLTALDVNLSDFQIFNNSASTLIARKGNDLYKVDTSAGEVTLIMKNVLNYDFYDQEIVFLAKDAGAKDSGVVDSKAVDPEAEKYRIGVFRLNSPENVTYLEKTYDQLVRVYISQFYDDKYITVVDGQRIVTTKRDDGGLFFEGRFSFTPENIKIGHDGEFITAYTGSTIATVDFEALAIREWTIEAEKFSWLDSDMIYTIVDGKLIVYDFNGENRREISSGVSSNVFITNNKYLYYFNDGKLIREIISK